MGIYREFTRYDALWFNKGKYLKMIVLSLLKIIPFFLLLIAFALLVTVSLFSSKNNDFNSGIVTNLQAMLGVILKNDENTVLLTLELVLGTTFGFIVAAFIAVSLSKPIKPIEFSKVIVVNDQDGEKRLRVRYWIKVDDLSYARDVRNHVEILTLREKNRGVGNVEAEASYREFLPMARGVRYIEVPLASAKKDNDSTFNEALERFLSQHDDGDRNKERLLLRIKTLATLPNGYVDSYIKYYSPDDVFIDYQFLSIRQSEINDDPYKGKEPIYMNHFNIIYSLDKERDVNPTQEMAKHSSLICERSCYPSAYDAFRNFMRRTVCQNKKDLFT